MIVKYIVVKIYLKNNLLTLKYKITFVSPSFGLDSSEHFLRNARIVDKLTENLVKVFCNKTR